MPKGMQFKSESYYFVTTTAPRKWVRLGRNYLTARKAYDQLSVAEPDAIDDLIKKLQRKMMAPSAADLRPVTKYSGTETMKALAAQLLSRSQISANARGIDNELTEEDIVEMLKQCRGRCAVSGIEFSYKWEHPDWRSRPWVPSIDRVDNTRGYYKNNCRIVCHAVNRALSEWGADVFAKMCEAFIKTKEL